MGYVGVIQGLYGVEHELIGGPDEFKCDRLIFHSGAPST